MMNRLTKILAVLAALATPQATLAKNTEGPASEASLHAKFVAVKDAYRQGSMSKAQVWAALSDLHDRGSLLSKADRVALLETQAVMLLEGSYPILAAIYASQALTLAPEPLATELEPAWQILARVAEKRPIQGVLETLADTVHSAGKTVPVFGADWGYYAGNAAVRRGDTDKALALYGEVGVDNRHFLPAKYQQALIYVDQEHLGQAEANLKTMLAPAALAQNTLPPAQHLQMNDYARMALGRLYYEERRFDDSVTMYRAVRRDGQNFYDALFEQSWAFFMGGYPMHALGALHAVESPFYAGVFNPEAPMLRSMVHYWLCRYDDSRNALADFMERYKPEVEQLADFLDRQHLDAETSYTLFENMLSGVSDESLGVSRSILKTAAEKDSMLLVRDQYASILEEKEQLAAKGVFGDQSHSAKPLDYMDRWSVALRKEVGSRFLGELVDLKQDYDRLYAQAQFLYVELLMSQKDQLLGKELHGDTKITRVDQQMHITGWAAKTQAWKNSLKGEYWWDEVGFYITPVNSMCTVPAGGLAH